MGASSDPPVALLNGASTRATYRRLIRFAELRQRFDRANGEGNALSELTVSGPRFGPTLVARSLLHGRTDGTLPSRSGRNHRVKILVQWDQTYLPARRERVLEISE